VQEDDILKWKLRDHLYRDEWGETDRSDVEVVCIGVGVWCVFGYERC